MASLTNAENIYDQAGGTRAENIYVELCCKTNFSFLTGASTPRELVDRAYSLGMPALAITDDNGVYGIPKAYSATKNL